MGASDHLNFDQVRTATEKVQVPDGGFTVKAYGPNRGQGPRSTFMVGVPGHGINGIDNVSHEDVLGFMESREQPLRHPDQYMGGWNDPETGLTSLDVSRSVPDYYQAQHLAVAGNEKAIGSIGPEGEYVGTIDSTVPRRIAQGKAFLKRR